MLGGPYKEEMESFFRHKYLPTTSLCIHGYDLLIYLKFVKVSEDQKFVIYEYDTTYEEPADGQKWASAYASCPGSNRIATRLIYGHSLNVPHITAGMVKLGNFHMTARNPRRITFEWLPVIQAFFKAYRESILMEQYKYMTRHTYTANPRPSERFTASTRKTNYDDEYHEIIVPPFPGDDVFSPPGMEIC